MDVRSAALHRLEKNGVHQLDDRGAASAIEKIIITNTIPLTEIDSHPKFVQLSIAQTFADTISRITTNRSVSELFTGDETAEETPKNATLLEPAIVS